MSLLIDDIIGLLSPHICKECGSIGATYCRRCIFNTIKRNDHICLYCRQPAEHNNVCDSCCKKYHLFDDVIAIGPRKGSLKSLVGDYKYNSELASCRPIAELLAAKIAGLNQHDEIEIVPIPTISAHVRQRGFDHTGSNLMLFVVSLPRSMFDESSLVRLCSLVKSKETLI